MGDRRWRELPAPDPDTVRAARAHLTGKYSRGVDRLMWEAHKHPLADLQGIRAVIDTASDGGEVDATDLGAALVLMEAMRLDVDRLERQMLESARDSGLTWESIAAILALAGAAEAQERHRWLESRQAEPVAPIVPPDLSTPARTRQGAERAGRRARTAADRAADAARRRQELDGERRRAARPSESARSATARAEAGTRTAEARERAALGLLRAADSEERDAVAAAERAATSPDEEQVLIAKAAEFRATATVYRRLAHQMRLP
jgi:hypothetical protein